MRRALLAAIVIALFLLHQDVWFWRSPDPLLFGFLPIALSYHALFSIAAAGLMWALVRHAWPAHLDVAGESPEYRGIGSGAETNTPQNGRLRDKEDRT